jgi:inositol-phosphate transport system permease protein
MFLIVIGIVVAMLGWRLFDMRQLLQRPRIEVH